MVSNRWTLEGKRALITGGTKGIGFAIAQEILELGGEWLNRVGPNRSFQLIESISKNNLTYRKTALRRLFLGAKNAI